MVGASGEFYVLARLSLLGEIAAQAPEGAPTADILIASSAGDRLCSVQVKARQAKGSDHGWHMSKKHEAIKSASLFYAFFDFGKLTEPKPITYIVPSAVVAEVLQSMHRAWHRGELFRREHDRLFCAPGDVLDLDEVDWVAALHRQVLPERRQVKELVH